MNERIRELAEQAGFFPELNWDHTGWHAAGHNNTFEKFAELIVRECASYMYEHYPHSRYEINYMRKHMGDADWNKPIEKHFGVEE
jgi:uncharacterized membrane protein